MEENKNAIIEQDNGENEELANQLDEQVKKPLLTEIARKKHFREKFEKEKEARQNLEEEVKNLKENLVALKKAEAEKAKPSSTASVSDELEEILSLKRDNYSDSHVLEARKLAKRMNASLKEVVETPYFKAWVDAERNKAKVEQATPSSSDRVSRLSVNNKPWSEMTTEERKANLGNVLQNLGTRGGNKSNL